MLFSLRSHLTLRPLFLQQHRRSVLPFTAIRTIKAVSPSSFLKDFPQSPPEMLPKMPENDRLKLRQLYLQRARRPKQSRAPLPPRPLASGPIPLDAETRNCLLQIHQDSQSQGDGGAGSSSGVYAKVDINTQPYFVQLNDLVITKKLPGSRVGDILSLTKVREVGSRRFHLSGKPYVNEGYIDIQAVVLEQGRSAKYTELRRRLGQGPGDRKFRKRSRRVYLTLLRISHIGIRSEVLQQQEEKEN